MKKIIKNLLHVLLYLLPILLFALLILVIFHFYYQFILGGIHELLTKTNMRADMQVFLYFWISIIFMAVFHWLGTNLSIAICKKVKENELILYMDTVILLAFIIYYSIAFHKYLPDNNVKHEFSFQVITVYFMIYGIIQNNKKSSCKDKKNINNNC